MERKFPDPLDKMPLGDQDQQLDPYRKGFRKREFRDNGDVEETHLIVPRLTWASGCLICAGALRPLQRAWAS